MATTRETTISKVKTALRVGHSVLDADISDTIDACLADLSICGLLYPTETDPAVLAEIKLYCRAAYESDTAKADAYQRRYDAMKATLMMAEDYREG